MYILLLRLLLLIFAALAREKRRELDADLIGASFLPWMALWWLVMQIGYHHLPTPERPETEATNWTNSVRSIGPKVECFILSSWASSRVVGLLRARSELDLRNEMTNLIQ